MGRFLTLGAFFFLALVVIGATIPSFIDWQTYREPIERAASDAIGRDVKITGSVGFTILPYPSVDLGGVTVANQADGLAPNLLTLETLSAKLALAPLLRGAVKIKTFGIEGADLKLERGDGQVNWSFSQGRNDGASSNGRIESLLIKAIRDVSIEDFSAKDLKISYTDTLSGQAYDWEIKHGQASLASMNGPFEAEGRVILGGEAFYVTGKIGTSRPDSPRPVILDALTADGLSLKFDGAADRSNGGLVIQGRTEIKAPAAHQLGVPFAAITGSSRNAWVGGSTLDLPAKLVGQLALSTQSLKGSELEIEIGTVRGLGYLDLALGQSVTGTMKIQSKALDLDELVSALKGGAAKEADTGPDVDIDIAVAARVATLRETRLDGVELSIRLLNTGPALGSFKATLPGQTKVDYALKKAGSQRGVLNLETSDARAFLTWVGADLQGSRKRAFRNLSLQGDVILSDKDIKLTGLTATLDGAKFEGALVRTRSERPSFGANLKIMGLDLERFGTGSDVEAWLGYMNAFDINAILKLRQFTGFDLERRSVDIKAQVVRGALTLEDLQTYGSPGLRLRGKLKKDTNGALVGAMRVDAKDLALCTAIQKRSAVTLPGCADNPKFKANGKFDIVAGEASGTIVATSPTLAFEGKLGGVQSIFASALGLTFDGKGEAGKTIYQIAGTASGKADETQVTAKLQAEAPKLEIMTATFVGMKQWSKPLLALVETRGATVLAADFDIAPGATRFSNLELGFGSASLTGSGSVTRDDTGNRFDVELSGQNLKLLKAHGAAGWSTGNLELALPKDADGTLALTLTNIVLGGIPVSSASLKGEIKAGGLELNINEAQAFGGKWEGDVTLHEGKGGLVASVEGKARDLNLQEFLKTSLGAQGLSGEGDMTFAVSTDGRSWKSLVENSAGLVDLKAWNGSVRGFDLPGFSSGLKEAAGELGARLVVEGALSTGATKYTNLEAEMTLAGGKLRAISLVGDLEGGDLSGDGEINLAALTWKGRTVIDLEEPGDLPKIQSAVSGALAKPRQVWDAEELVLKFTEAWLIANQTTEMADLPGAQGSGVSSEELDDLLAPAPE